MDIRTLVMVALLAAGPALAQDEYLPQQGSPPARTETPPPMVPAPAEQPAPEAPAPAAAPSAVPAPAPAASAPPNPATPGPIEGCVVVGFHVLSSGEPVEMEILDSVPKGRFDKGAMKGLEKWRFPPQAGCQGRYWQKLEFRTNPPGPPAERACAEPPAPDCKAVPPRG